jgi:hypothetical protein
MTHREHEQTNHARQHEHHHAHKRKGIHKDWRVWLAVLLMLAGMAMYLLTMDESLGPNNPPGQKMPAAGAPAAG